MIIFSIFKKIFLKIESLICILRTHINPIIRKKYFKKNYFKTKLVGGKHVV